MPLTPILFLKCYGIDGISVEIVPEIAKLKERVLGKLGYGSEIDVVCGDETVLADLKCDAVVVAALPSLKREFSGMSNV